MRIAVLYGIAALIAGIGVWALLGRGGAEATAAGPVDLARGRALYEENCSSCHGSELQGQPDWQSPGPDGRLPAPPHDETGHTWHHPDTVLFDYTKLGGNALMAQQGVDFDSGMPGFGDILTDRQIRDVLAFIRSTWPERIRDIQADRTLAQDGAG